MHLYLFLYIHFLTNLNNEKQRGKHRGDGKITAERGMKILEQTFFLF